MGRKSNAEYKRTPHGDGPAESLWWYRLPESKRDAVIAAYVKQCGRGRALPEDFRLDVEGWLRNLNTKQSRHKWWTIPAYAKANKLHPYTLMKRCRELEEIAKELFPNAVPPGRITEQLTDGKVAAIRTRYAELIDDMNGARVVAQEFCIEPFRVGLLCKDLKDAAKAKREQAISESSNTAAVHHPWDDEPPLI
jgi:hypothetical protein